MAQLSQKGKKGITIIAIIIGVITLGMYAYNNLDLEIIGKKVAPVTEIELGDYETEEAMNVEVRETANYDISFNPLPSKQRIAVRGNVKKMSHCGIMWNGHAAFAEANGGAITRRGSYFDKLGRESGSPFFLKLGREDDYSVQQDKLAISLDGYLKSGRKDMSQGTAMVSFMGDNAEMYLTQANAKLDAIAKQNGLDPDDVSAEIFCITGYSDGEDKAMGLQAWKDDPELALGQVFACYPQDGDQNLIIKWASDNGLLINPDGETYCANAINFAFVDGFMEAAQAYGTMTGERVVVEIDPETGKTRKTGERKSVEILGSGTWTPGDEVAFNKAKKRGENLVSLYDTHDNRHQMPCVLVTYNLAINDNPEIFESIVEGVVRAGDQIKVHDEAFDYAMEAMSDVFDAQTPAYWKKYFGGVTAKTVDGYPVRLGGSRTVNLADNLDAFGVGEDARGTFKSSYELFGGYMQQLYPEFLPERLPFHTAINTRPLESVRTKMARSGEITERSQTSFGSGRISDKVAERSYAVEFQTGSARLTSAGVRALELMHNDLNTHELRIKVSGHTDNTGTDQVNIPLSQKRAQAVKDWLQKKSQQSYPNARFSEVKGYGSTRPLANVDANSTAGRAKNRRVEILVGY